MSTARWARIGFSLLAWLFAAGTIILVYLAGQAVWGTPASYELHRNLGFIFGLLPLVLIVLSLAGRMPRVLLLTSVVLLGLMIVQSVLVRLDGVDPNVRALHPVSGVLIVGLAVWLANASMRQLRAPMPVDHAAEATARRQAEAAAAAEATAAEPRATRDDETT